MSVTLTLTDEEMGTLWDTLDSGSEPVTPEDAHEILRDHGPGALAMHRAVMESRATLLDEVMRQWSEQEDAQA